MSVEHCPDCHTLIRADTGICECGWKAGKKPLSMGPIGCDYVNQPSARPCKAPWSTKTNAGKIYCAWHLHFPDPTHPAKRVDLDHHIERIRHFYPGPDSFWSKPTDVIWRVLCGEEAA